MPTPLCPCSNLEWLPEHYTLEHHPDCQRNDNPAFLVELNPERFLKYLKLSEPFNTIGSSDGSVFGFHCGIKASARTTTGQPFELRCRVCNSVICDGEA